MRPRLISKLRFQFGRFDPDMTADELCEALIASRMIELLDGHPKRYVETKAMRDIDPHRFESVIAEMIRKYKRGV